MISEIVSPSHEDILTNIHTHTHVHTYIYKWRDKRKIIRLELLYI